MSNLRVPGKVGELGMRCCSRRVIGGKDAGVGRSGRIEGGAAQIVKARS